MSAAARRARWVILLLLLVALIWKLRSRAASDSTPTPEATPSEPGPTDADSGRDEAEPTAEATATSTEAEPTAEATAMSTEAEPTAEAEPPSTPTEAEPANPWTDPVDGVCPVSHPIKVNTDSGIFHVPGGAHYARVKPERCYTSAEAAEADGFRQSRT